MWTASPAVFLLLAAQGSPSRRSSQPSFEVLWNSWYPTQCRRYGDNTSAADFQSLGIATNANATFNGDRITLFYENLGYYPVIPVTNPEWCDPQQADTENPEWCNGGIPQRTDIARHVAKVKVDVSRDIPDPLFSGFGVIECASTTFDPHAQLCFRIILR
jgi:hypothetical protein